MRATDKGRLKYEAEVVQQKTYVRQAKCTAKGETWSDRLVLRLPFSNVLGFHLSFHFGVLDGNIFPLVCLEHGSYINGFVDGDGW